MCLTGLFLTFAEDLKLACLKFKIMRSQYVEILYLKLVEVGCLNLWKDLILKMYMSLNERVIILEY